MKKHSALALFLFAAPLATILLVPAMAQGTETITAPAPDDNVQHRFGITFSPIHLVLPMAELTGEYRATDKIGVAVVLGVGRMKVKTNTLAGTVEDSFTALEGGAQFRYYLFGSFIHGMQLGAEALWLYVDRDKNSSLSASGEGLAIGPFVGYKIATNIGFTFDTQLGVEYLTARSKASDTVTSASANDSAFIPLLNINVGWSF